MGIIKNPTSTIQKAYNRGYRMGEYIKARDGIEKAIDRGSKANIVYRMRGLIGAYDRGYHEAISA